MSGKIRKVCSNCKKPYNLADKLPLCPDCIAELSGYRELVKGARISSAFVPRKSIDGPSIGSGA